LDGSLAVTGQIEDTTVRAGSRVGGRVATVAVDEGTRTEPGQILIRLETDEAEAGLAAAKAKLGEAEATLAKLVKGPREEEILRAQAAAEEANASYAMALKGARSEEIGVAQANVESTKAKMEEARTELERVQGLFDNQIISRQELDKAKFALSAAEGVYQAAVQQRDLLVAGTRDEQIAIAKAANDRAQAALLELKAGTRPEDIDVAQAVRDAAAADVAHAQVTLREMEIISPVAGVVESINLEPGDVVEAGPLVSIIDPEDLKLYVYVGAKALGSIHVGETVTLTTDAYGDKPFEGTVEFVASKGEFTPRNLQTEEERVQQVFRVKIHLNSAGGQLRAGMTATAHFKGVPGY
jgi:HlyD family secretion protein